MVSFLFLLASIQVIVAEDMFSHYIISQIQNCMLLSLVKCWMIGSFYRYAKHYFQHIQSLYSPPTCPHQKIKREKKKKEKTKHTCPPWKKYKGKWRKSSFFFFLFFFEQSSNPLSSFLCVTPHVRNQDSKNTNNIFLGIC